MMNAVDLKNGKSGSFVTFLSPAHKILAYNPSILKSFRPARLSSRRPAFSAPRSVQGGLVLLNLVLLMLSPGSGGGAAIGDFALNGPAFCQLPGIDMLMHPAI